MQVRVARMSTFGVGAVAILFGLLAQGLNVAVPVVLAIAVAASSNFPILVPSLFWRRFDTSGVIGGVTVGAALPARSWAPCWAGAGTSLHRRSSTK